MSRYTKKVILTIGRHWAQKNYFSLIEAYAQVRTHRQDVRLIILGKCPLKEGAELLAKRLNLEDVLSMPGWVAIPYANMSRADLFVLSSSSEGQPTVLIKALSYDCPVVSIDCP